MKITTKEETNISLFHLFVHDYEPGCDPYDEYCVAEEVNERLTKEGLEYELEKGDGLRRWTILRGDETNRFPHRRVYSIEDAKTEIGIESSFLLHALEKIDQGGIEL